MRIRTILAAVSGGPAGAGAIELGCRLACRFEAHLEGFHVLADPRALLAANGQDIIAPPTAGLIAGAVAEAAERAAAARVAFDDLVGRHGIAQSDKPAPHTRRPSAAWRERTGFAAALVAEHARFFDIVVLGRSERVAGEPHTQTIERTLQHSGRPVLLAPLEPPAGLGSAIAIAWNGSPEAVRALAAAMPFLETARTVALITIGAAARAGGIGPVSDYLRWHGIRAEHRPADAASGRHAGQALLDAARDCGADLLVMGAYGHAPWREILLGGATRDALAHMPLPLFLMH